MNETTAKWADSEIDTDGIRRSSLSAEGVAGSVTEFPGFSSFAVHAGHLNISGNSAMISIHGPLAAGVRLDEAKLSAEAALPELRRLMVAAGLRTDDAPRAGDDAAEKLRRLTDAIAEASRVIESERLSDEEGGPGDPEGIALASLIGLAALARELTGADRDA